MRILIATALAVLLAVPAFAYTPHVGDRANDITGRDMQTDTVKSLADYAGQWVFIDFWATWCGPCMGELPNLIQETADLRASGKLQVFSVSLDFTSTADEIAKVVKKMGIDYPVLYDGNGWKTVQSVEWGINSIPATFLINPQGVIVATNLRGEALRPALDFFLNYPGVYTPVGLRTSHVKNDDGSLTVRIEAASPQHTPLRCELDYYHVRYTWADDDPEHKNRPVDSEYIEQDAEKAEQSFDIVFEDFGDAVQELTIPAVENTQMIGYTVRVMLPGTEALNNGEGLWASATGRLRLDK